MTASALNAEVLQGPYRASEFNCIVESYFPGTWLIFNTASGQLLVADDERLTALERVFENPAGFKGSSILEDLVALGFITSELDERAALRDRYFAARSHQPADHLALTISPTVACNLRCGYCFQEHPARTVSDLDVRAIRAFVKSKLPAGGRLHVTWFGGEPLLAFPALQKLYAELAEEVGQVGGQFSHDIITNGMLLQGERLEWLAKTNIGTVQVTIDGPQAIHDARRPRAGGAGTFETILSNLSVAAGRIPISLRINVDRRNASALPELVDELFRRNLQNVVFPYLGHVLAYTSECGDLAPHVLTNEEFAAVKLEFLLYMVRRGARPGRTGLPRPILGAFCTADSANGFVISPGGRVVGCWNEAATDEVGGARLKEDGTLFAPDASALSRWKRYDPFGHSECKTCLVQPLCRGGCPWESAKLPTIGTGLCTPLKWSLDEELRLYHLWESIQPSGASNGSVAGGSTNE